MLICIIQEFLYYFSLPSKIQYMYKNVGSALTLIGSTIYIYIPFYIYYFSFLLDEHLQSIVRACHAKWLCNQHHLPSVGNQFIITFKCKYIVLTQVACGSQAF